ncbi:MAG: N-formylglutamate amidohydrolase [Hyphomicrobiales bacterium]|nr:N-formylglutamate amidohydrolase [Hyphomicrobiales bacterium]
MILDAFDAVTPAFEVAGPSEPATPLVVCSPPSGRHYPPGFVRSARLDPLALRRSEDAYVDRLIAGAEAAGATCLTANFPRAWLDVNREPYELDPRMFRGRLPSFANTRSLRVASGLGAIPRVVADSQEIYSERMGVDEGMARIEGVHRPFHATLRGLVDRARRRFGLCVLVDCHSMPSISCASPEGGRRPDFVIGDRYGQSSAPVWVGAVEAALRGRGRETSRNRPYAGGYITERYGEPSAGVHAVQVEVNRALYMDEATVTPHGRIAAVTADFDAIWSALRALMDCGGEALVAAE